MTLEEKIAQLGSIWHGRVRRRGRRRPDAGPVQPTSSRRSTSSSRTVSASSPGCSAPGRWTPAAGMRALAALQARIVAASRFGIPAVAHEECLTGFAAWGATIYPTPLAWGAVVRPGAGRRDGGGRSARRCARSACTRGSRPVLDVTRDYRWGRTEETIGEDPYLVGTVGTAYVQGLQSSGLQATLKHFAGYSASRAGRNHGAGLHGPARVRRRHPRPVRDGHQARRRPLGDADLHRPSTACPQAPTRAC